MKKILIIDDDQSTIESISSYLAEIGYRVKTAVNGIEGLEMAEEFSPDLIITDIRMPKLNGIELLHILREMKYDKPVIFITSYDNNETREKKYDVFAQIQKPINIFDLNKRIEKALSEYENAA